MRAIKIVVAVEKTYYTNLTGMKWLPGNRVWIPEQVKWKSIPIRIPASMTITSKDEDKNTVWTAQMKFQTCADVYSRHHDAWRITLQDGRKYLLGSDQRPFTTMQINENMPDNPTGSQLNEVSVSYQTLRKIPIIKE